MQKIVGLFCKRDLYKRRYSTKETYNLIDPTDRSHPIVDNYGVATFLLGSIKLQVSFAEYFLFYKALLQKRLIILHGASIVTIVGSIKLQVSFAEYYLFYRGLLQKRPAILHGGAIVTMGWLRFVGSIKLQVSSAEYHLFYKALLSKRSVILHGAGVVHGAAVVTTHDCMDLSNDTL